MKFFIFLILISFSFELYATLIPVQYRNQEQQFHKGTPYIISTKNKSDVRLVGLDVTILQNRASFSFSITNHSKRKVNFLTENLTVYDQSDREIQVVPKLDLIEQAKTSAWWNKVYSNISYLIEFWYSPEYGFLSYTLKNRKRRQLYSPGLVKQAQDMAALKEDRRQEKILTLEEKRVAGYEEHYFGSHTITAGETYSANIQITVSQDQLDELEFIYFAFMVGGEQHIFCTRYEAEKSWSWWPQIFK